MNYKNLDWKKLFSGLFISVSWFVFSQENNIKFQIIYHPTSDYVAPVDSASRDGSSSMVELALSSQFNLYKKIDTVTGKVNLLSAAVYAKQTSFSNSGFNKEILPEELHSISAGVSYYSSINPKWAYAVFVNSALNSDFIEIDYNDLFLTGGVQFIRHFSPNLRLGFGVIVHNNLGKPMVWPALSVYWRFGGKFNFDIRVPDEGHGLAYGLGVGYQYNENLKFGFAFKPQVISYDVEIRDAIDKRLMNFWQLPFELSGTYSKGKLDYHATVGFSALRSFAYAEKDIKNMFTKYPYHSLNFNLLLGVGIKYHF